MFTFATFVTLGELHDNFKTLLFYSLCFQTNNPQGSCKLSEWGTWCILERYWLYPEPKNSNVKTKKKKNLLQEETLNRMIHYLLFLSLCLCHIIALHSIKCTSEHHQEETEKWDSSLIFIHSDLCDQHGVERVWQRRLKREPAPPNSTHYCGLPDTFLLLSSPRVTHEKHWGQSCQLPLVTHKRLYKLSVIIKNCVIAYLKCISRSRISLFCFSNFFII